MRIAAIDLGSNAVRLAIAECDGSNGFETIYKVRKPLRLGTEAFSQNGELSQSTLQKAVETFSFFAKVMKEEQVKKYKAFATSAFRDAKNSGELAAAVRDVTGIQIEQMSGNLEAEVVLNSVLQHMELNPEKNYLLCDLGGGSLELSKIEAGSIIGSKSFDLGTVRLMTQLESRKASLDNILSNYREDVSSFLNKKSFSEKRISIIGTGGNFRRLLKIRNSACEDDKKRHISPQEFWDIKSLLQGLTFEERVDQLELRADCADVIITAVEIIDFVMQDLDISKIFAPKAGLVQGILENLSEQYC